MNFPDLKILSVIWFSFLAFIAILGLLVPLNPNFEIASFFVVFIHTIVVLLVLISLPLQIKSIFIWAFLARVLFMIWDIYGRNIFGLPNSGADTEMYYGTALRISHDISLLNSPHRGGIYAKIIGILFYIIGPQRMVAQYLNVLIGLFVVIIVYKILTVLQIMPQIIKIVVLIAAFFPNSLVMSAILLREIIPTFFVALSLYSFIRWYKFGSNANLFLSLLMLGLSSMFHSGVIGIFIGYAFFYLFFKQESNKFLFSSQTVVTFVLLGGVSLLASTQFGDALFGKFQKVEEIDDILATANTRLGNSTYLTGMTINTLPQLIIYGPIKMFYFLTSPLPMNWRGGMDIFSFVFDSSLYFITLWFIWKNWQTLRDRKPLIIGLIITLIGVAFIFGIGVGNAGTAIRHRQKIIPLMLILLAVMMDEKSKYNLYRYNFYGT